MLVSHELKPCSTPTPYRPESCRARSISTSAAPLPSFSRYASASPAKRGGNLRPLTPHFISLDTGSIERDLACLKERESDEKVELVGLSILFISLKASKAK